MRTQAKRKVDTLSVDPAKHNAASASGSVRGRVRTGIELRAYKVAMEIQVEPLNLPEISARLCVFVENRLAPTLKV